jgi:hypothetical protein
MSKHGKRSEHVQPGRPHGVETAVTGQPDAGAARAGLTGEAVPGEGVAVDANAVGKYWIVIILWTIGFATMIGFEVIAAVFRR